jgi:hypothetical protein
MMDVGGVRRAGSENYDGGDCLPRCRPIHSSDSSISMKAFRALLRFLAILLVLLAGCTSDPVSPTHTIKEVRLQVSYGGLGAMQTEWVGGPGYESRLIGFDIRNYPDVDSIVFMCRVWSEEPGADITLRLYNITDSVAIAGSEMHGRDFHSLVLYSSNLRRAIPDHPVDLALQLKSDGLITSGTCNEGAFLLLYDK